MAYTPYKMAAVGSSPITKNFGDKEQRGFKESPVTLKTFGVDDSDGVDKISTTPNKSVSVGSSPAKGWLSNIASSAKKAFGIGGRGGGGGGGAAPVAADPATAQAVEGGDAPAVPPHGDESHSGGAIGGEAAGGEPAPFEAMDRKEYRSMGAKDRMGYMKGLSSEDRRSQMKSNMKGGMMGMFGGGGGGGGFGNLFSDSRLKEKICRTGISPSGIPIYEFNYIGDNSRYSGAMAQDLLNTEHVTIHESGFYMVNYDNIDIDMKLV